jgi:predicted metalloprotease
MRWRGGRRSQNVEDRRGMTVSRGVAGGGIGAVILALIAMALGVDPGVVLQGDPTGGSPSAYPTDAPPHRKTTRWDSSFR